MLFSCAIAPTKHGYCLHIRFFNLSVFTLKVKKGICRADLIKNFHAAVRGAMVELNIASEFELDTYEFLKNSEESPRNMKQKSSKFHTHWRKTEIKLSDRVQNPHLPGIFLKLQSRVIRVYNYFKIPGVLEIARNKLKLKRIVSSTGLSIYIFKVKKI